MQLTKNTLRSKFIYNPKTGLFTNRKTGKIFVKGGGPYKIIKIDGVMYLGHRLAFLYMTGRIPKMIDHKNRDGTDNRWSNIRPANQGLNNANSSRPNKTGFKGVGLLNGRYRAKFRYKGKFKCLGYYNTAEEASRAYQAELIRVFGKDVCFLVRRN
jgi:hypothetical protein